jgi:hypothetical protein
MRPHLDQKNQERLNKMFNPNLAQDATYRVLTAQFSHWLAGAQMAMEDEGLPDHLVQRVLNRMIYGHPDGAGLVLNAETQRAFEDYLKRDVRASAVVLDAASARQSAAARQ